MKKLTYQEVKNFVESKHCELMSTEYLGAYVKIDVLCEFKKHIFSVTFNNFKHRNSRCPECEKDRISLRCKTPYDKVVEQATSNGLKLLTSREEYEKNHKKKLKISLECLVCKRPNITTVGMLNTGRGCKRCKDKISGKEKRKNYCEIEKEIKDRGYTLLTKEYTGNKQQIKMMCDRHGIFQARLNDILTNKSGCPRCSMGGMSKAEAEIFDILKAIFLEIKKARFKVNIPSKPFIKGFELDILNKENSKAIEYDGSYYHSYKHMRNQPKRDSWPDEDLMNYHLIKDSFFQKYYGIEVLHIKETDWNRDKDYSVKLATAWLGGECSIYPKSPKALDI